MKPSNPLSFKSCLIGLGLTAETLSLLALMNPAMAATKAQNATQPISASSLLIKAQSNLQGAPAAIAVTPT